MATKSHWRLEDLQDLEQYGLAAELESTKLESTQNSDMGQQHEQDFEAYNMSEVLSNLLTDDQSLLDDSSFSFSPLLGSPHSLVHNQTPPTMIGFLKAPSAYGIKKTQDKLTYINKGYSYEIDLRVDCGERMSADTVYKSVLSLGFCEIRLRNSEQEQFDQWSREHPLERLLEINKVSCDGLSSVQNDENCLSSVSFLWSPLRPALLSFKLNCLSTEFAARKHGGEKGVPIRLKLDTCLLSQVESSSAPSHIHRAACTIKVFKDKGADRKQRQDQLKMEKLQQNELSKFHESTPVTPFVSLILPFPELDSPRHTTAACPSPSGAASLFLATPTSASGGHVINGSELSETSSRDNTRLWLEKNRFGQYVSLFANYTGADLLRLSRRDLFDLCGAADGIRLYNTLRIRMVKVFYICMEHEKVFQALCLEQLTASHFLSSLAEKMNIQVSEVSSLVRLTVSGIMVMVDDNVVQNMRDEETFILQVIKEENGTCQLILRDHTPTPGISMHGTAPRHN